MYAWHSLLVPQAGQSSGSWRGRYQVSGRVIGKCQEPNTPQTEWGRGQGETQEMGRQCLQHLHASVHLWTGGLGAKGNRIADTEGSYSPESPCDLENDFFLWALAMSSWGALKAASQCPDFLMSYIRRVCTQKGSLFLTSALIPEIGLASLIL